MLKLRRELEVQGCLGLIRRMFRLQKPHQGEGFAVPDLDQTASKNTSTFNKVTGFWRKGHNKSIVSKMFSEPPSIIS